ncbi:hypothetical protein L7F22_025230 [Adiantum nelumboides]|nr:hypothetical protein [Adiantum nelumboides]
MWRFLEESLRPSPSEIDIMLLQNTKRKGPIFIGKDTPLRPRFSPLKSDSDTWTKDRVVYQLMLAIEAMLESIRVRVQDNEELVELTEDGMGRLVRLDPDPFLNELTKLYEQHRDKGTVWVTLKRVHLDWKKKRKTTTESEDETVEYRCLVRATDGKKNISALLSAKDHQRFQMAYATVLKAHMDALKKREKKDKKEKKAAAAAAVSTATVVKQSI